MTNSAQTQATEAQQQQRIEAIETRAARTRAYCEAIIDSHEGISCPRLHALAESLAWRCGPDTTIERSLLQEVMHAACEIWIMGYDSGFTGAITSGDYVPVEGLPA